MKKTLLIVFILSISKTLWSQSLIGYETDNFNGVHGVTVNPANIADARVQIDVNLFSVGALIANDYTNFSLSNMIDMVNGDLNNLGTLSSTQNEVLANAEVLGPSFMFNINEKHSIGLITKARMSNTFNNISGEFFEGIVDGFPSDNFSFEQNNLNATTHIWGEVGLAYGRVLYYDYDQHYLKGGLTLKYLMGAGVAQATSSTLNGSFNATSNQVSLNGELSYLISYDQDQNTGDYAKDMAPGFGLDVGVVYEYRTRGSRFADADDNPRALNKYRAKIGVSVLDIGSITYKDTELTNYNVNGGVNADEIEEDFIDALDNNFTSTSAAGDVTVALPTTLRVNIDYKIIPLVYANLDIHQTLVKKEGPYNNNGLNQITLTPRFETRAISIYLPVTYSALGSTSLGAGFKLGPVIIGSGSILSNLLTESAQTANIYFGFKVPINHKR
ncbi:DUF5723 family protein [Flagellimonas myxillae]|uniref:DUF5723 family protein n=1 Tax=Flagellimonas myxillae TaxID=2942214 RepID=UPI00201EE708|nr:DUF5723 family protein [Muricauda myxillae]MCL6265076.1 DUF5723 family protein [Muricauda myxillae]